MTTQHQTAAPLRLTPEGIIRTTTSDRFDLEQQIMQCWQIVDDIHVMYEMGTTVDDLDALASVYDYKFKRMWHTFEALVKAREL
jgi:hypothetical protein